MYQNFIASFFTMSANNLIIFETLKKITMSINRIRKDIEQRLKLGDSKQEILDDLLSKYNNSKQLANIIRFIPYPELIKKYGIWNKVFLVFILILTAGTLAHPIASILFGIMAFAIATKRFEFYWISTILGFMLIFITFGIAITSKNDFNLLIPVVSMIASAVLIGGGIFLPNLITPNYKVTKVLHSTDGINKIKLVYKFD